FSILRKLRKEEPIYGDQVPLLRDFIANFMTNLPPNNNNNKNGRSNNENNILPIPQVLPRTIDMKNVPIPYVGGIVIREAPSNEVSTPIVREGLSKRLLAQHVRSEKEKHKTTNLDQPMQQPIQQDHSWRSITQCARIEREGQQRESGYTGSPAPENITKTEFFLPLPPDSVTTLEEPHRTTEMTNLLSPAGHTNSVLSK
ncbi:hypothetical protein GIB67_028292, partial [Kingdonia uniflora]